VNRKYCPAGKVCCEHMDFDSCSADKSADKHESAYRMSLRDKEQCPWPSKIRTVDDVFEKAFDVFCRKIELLPGTRIRSDEHKTMFIDSLVAAGLDE